MTEFIKAFLFVVVAEMGDKTQLMTIAISAESHTPIFILIGTTIGMLIADGIGVLGGAWMCKHIPEKYIKWGAGIIFMVFGTFTLYNTVPSWLITPLYLISYYALLGVLIYLIGIKFSFKVKNHDIALNSNEENLKENSQ